MDTKSRLIALVFGTALTACISSAFGDASAEEESGYRAVITERAAKIAEALGLKDEAQVQRVTLLISDQYRALRDAHAARDARLAEAQGGGDEVAAAIRQQSECAVVSLHRTYLARLSAELTAAQVDSVKDGMTYGVAPMTYVAYQELLPDLSEEQRRTILANLLEAREYAMDAGSSDEKHATFGKYKGRINNYLSKAGFDLKEAERQRSQVNRQSSRLTRSHEGAR